MKAFETRMAIRSGCADIRGSGNPPATRVAEQTCTFDHSFIKQSGCHFAIMAVFIRFFYHHILLHELCMPAYCAHSWGHNRVVN